MGVPVSRWLESVGRVLEKRELHRELQNSAWCPLESVVECYCVCVGTHLRLTRSYWELKLNNSQGSEQH